MEVVTKNQTRAMGQRVLQMFSDVLNSISAELENIPRPLVRVFSVAGSTVTATLGETILTAIEESAGIWELKLPRYGAWTITSTTPSGETYSKVVEVDDVKKYVAGLGIEVKRYGYRIKEAEPDPYERVEYILDAVGMTPAHMDFENEVFDYGSWQNVWFVADNKPLMLKYDGTVDYYLDPNDYTLREDGETASDVANVNYEGNAMAQFPLCWIYRYEDDTYKYEIVSNVKYDENYKAYAHTRADGSIAEYFYWGLFGGANISNKIRSIATQTCARNIYMDTMTSYVRANGTRWNIPSWSQKEYLRTLIVLLGKSTNTQAVFGQGNGRDEPPPTHSSYTLPKPTGALLSKGQFYGENVYEKQVKAFHVEALWNELFYPLYGAVFHDNTIYIKMTPEGNGYSYSNVTGYAAVLSYTPTILYGCYKRVQVNEYGLLPCEEELSGSTTTYYCDTTQYNTQQTPYYVAIQGGGLLNQSSSTGMFCVLFAYPMHYKAISFGIQMICEQPAV